jgi:alkanesulfonate monooxygenase SsuD/methylene tetrahydromethanopterin reductase-like flavin-dependent oxidoreductase (luciferase family)
MTPPDGYRSDLDTVQKAASDAGRNPDDVLPGVWLTGAVGEEGDKLREQAARGGKMFALHAPRHIGKKTDLPEGFDLTEFVPTDESKDALRQAMDEIPFEAVEDCLLCGDADECIETIDAFHRAGARLMVLSASGAGGNRRAGIEFIGKKVLPYFRDNEK